MLYYAKVIHIPFIKIQTLSSYSAEALFLIINCNFDN